jgi:hypothetical protein
MYNILKFLLPCEDIHRKRFQMFSLKYKSIAARSLILILCVISACTTLPSHDSTSPTIQQVTTSSKGFAKSDCVPTSLTVTANITDDDQIAEATLWYRVGSDQKFTAMKMTHGEQDQYTAKVIALDVPGGEYGVLEFYVVARDQAGNETKSPMDTSVQLLPCVAS